MGMKCQKSSARVPAKGDWGYSRGNDDTISVEDNSRIVHVVSPFGARYSRIVGTIQFGRHIDDDIFARSISWTWQRFHHIRILLLATRSYHILCVWHFNRRRDVVQGELRKYQYVNIFCLIAFDDRHETIHIGLDATRIGCILNDTSHIVWFEFWKYRWRCIL